MQLPDNECDLENSNFGVDENRETFADKELEKEEVPSIRFEAKEEVFEYWFSSKKSFPVNISFKEF